MTRLTITVLKKNTSQTLDNGKPFKVARYGDIPAAASALRYYAGYADKNHGKVIETDASKLTYTRHEPIGVVGQIIPWNFPLNMVCSL
jgi:aldehyde dehydrogenase (NAD+)